MAGNPGKEKWKKVKKDRKGDEQGNMVLPIKAGISTVGMNWQWRRPGLNIKSNKHFAFKSHFFLSVYM